MSSPLVQGDSDNFGPSSARGMHTRKGNAAGSGALRGLVSPSSSFRGGDPQRLWPDFGGQVCRGQKMEVRSGGAQTGQGTKAGRQWGLSLNFLHPPDPGGSRPGHRCSGPPLLLVAVSGGTNSFRAGLSSTGQ